MSLFGNKKTAFAAVAALAGKNDLKAADAQAANEELVAAGVTDAAIITRAEYQELTAKAGRTETAEKDATAAKASVTDLTAKLTASEKEVARLGALGGAAPTDATKKDGDHQEAPKTQSWFNKDHDHNKDAAALLG